MADRVSARRATANSFFLTVNTALLAFVSIGQTPVWLVCLGGVALSAAWWILIKSYRDLNKVKFDVITGMERNLTARIFSDEWDQLKTHGPKGWRSWYAEFNTVERIVPVVFAILYALALIKAML